MFRRDQSWVARPYDPQSGKARWLGTFPTKRKALDAVAEWRVMRTDPHRVRLSAFAEEWITQMEGRVRERTIRDYKTTNKQLVELLGDVPIGDITPRTVERMVAKSSKRYAGQTVRKQVTRLRQMLSTAVRWGWLPRNPAEGRLPLPAAAKRRIVPLTPEEAQRLVDAADPYYRPLFITAMQTGLRAGELFGLAWDHVDLEAGVLHVEQALSDIGRITPPKSAAAHRTLPLPPQTVAALTAHDPPETDLRLVFPAPWGVPMSMRTWSDIMREVAKNAELPDVRLHDLRHCYASLLIRSGCSPKLVQSLMGHATITTTFDRYGHLFPDEKGAAAVKVGEYFQSQNSSSK